MTEIILLKAAIGLFVVNHKVMLLALAYIAAAIIGTLF